MKNHSGYALQKKINLKVQEQINQLGSTFTTKNDGWMNVLTGLGVKGRDKNVSTAYRLCSILSSAELDQLYRGDGFVKRVIELPASEMIRQGWKIDGDIKDEVNSKLEEINAFQKLTDLIKFSRLYGGALIILGVADGRSLEMPVDENNIYDVCWLHCFDRYVCYSQDGTFEANLNSPNYGYPNIYTVNDVRTGNVFTVHHSRILRMDWATLPPRQQSYNDGWADSCLLSMYQELKNYSTAFANCGLIIQDFINNIMKIPDLGEKVASDCGNGQVSKRLDVINLSKSVANMLVLDKEEDLIKLTTNISGLPELLDRFMLTMSAVSGIPVSLLFGRSAAGLNATGDNDVRNFYDLIKQWQEYKLKPCLEKLIRYIFLSKNGPTNGIEPQNWGIKFTPLWQNTEEQIALIRRTVAETDRIYIESGVIDPSEVAISRFGGDTYSMETLIDVQSRQNGYNQQETELLESEKEIETKNSDPNPTVGPDFIQSNIQEPRRVY